MDLDDVVCDLKILRQSPATEFIILCLFFLSAPELLFGGSLGETHDPKWREAGGDTIDPIDVTL